MQILLADKIEGISQAIGASTLNFDAIDHVSRLQIDAETMIPTGRLHVLFLSPGLSSPKPLLGAAGNPIVIDLAAPYPVCVNNLSVAGLVFQPEGMAPNQTVRVGVVREINDGAMRLLNSRLLEATIEIDALEDLIGLHGGNQHHINSLTEWRSYRLTVCRVAKAGVTVAAVWPVKPEARLV